MHFIKIENCSINGTVSDEPFIINLEKVDFAYPYHYSNGNVFIKNIVSGTVIEFKETEEQNWEMLNDMIGKIQNRCGVVAVKPYDGWGFTVRSR